MESSSSQSSSSSDDDILDGCESAVPVDGGPEARQGVNQALLWLVQLYSFERSLVTAPRHPSGYRATQLGQDVEVGIRVRDQGVGVCGGAGTGSRRAVFADTMYVPRTKPYLGVWSALECRVVERGGLVP